MKSRLDKEAAAGIDKICPRSGWTAILAQLVLSVHNEKMTKVLAQEC